MRTERLVKRFGRIEMRNRRLVQDGKVVSLSIGVERIFPVAFSIKNARLHRLRFVQFELLKLLGKIAEMGFHVDLVIARARLDENQARPFPARNGNKPAVFAVDILKGFRLGHRDQFAVKIEAPAMERTGQELFPAGRVDQFRGAMGAHVEIGFDIAFPGSDNDDGCIEFFKQHDRPRLRQVMA